MFRVRQTQQFRKWLKGLRDSHARIRIAMRIERLEQGNLGDYKSLGDVLELRIDYGPGYRVYFMQHGEEIIIVLAGGDKRTQEKDIETARGLANSLREKSEDEN